MSDSERPPRRQLAPATVRATGRQLLYLPLGGTGEIGMNLNLYGHAGEWLMVDCGMMMDRDHGGREVLVPDPSFITQARESLCAIALTHAHMDHIGALATLWPLLRCPLYATRYTAAMIVRELERRVPPDMLEAVDLRIVEPGRAIVIGPFAVEWITLTHSIPEPSALAITTAAGTIVHTGDWKLDPTPVLGDDYDQQRLMELGRAGVLAVVGDSTNATVAGVSGSEKSLQAPLKKLSAGTPGRLVVTCFASNVARLCSLAAVARATGRRLALMGAGLEKTVGVARACGYWDDDTPLVPSRHVAYLPREEILAVVTGSQGESSAALARLARGQHRDLDLEAGDRVIFSSRVIPGNEFAIESLVIRLRALGVEVVQDGEHHVHVSGHPHADELDTLYRWLAPGLLVPTHGEARHLEANAAVGRAAGIPLTLNARNGDVCLIAGGQPGILGRIPTGRWRLDERTGSAEPVLPDRPWAHVAPVSRAPVSGPGADH